jgi:UDP-2,4-diacetamido-2,4,6-trideoxy-beta-L-altropyranose hydrolase
MGSKADLPPLLLRADADEIRGTGHIMRSLALACAWLGRGGQAHFLSCRPNPIMRRRIETTGAGLTEIEECHPDPADLNKMLVAVEEISIIAHQPPWIVLDGYHFDGAYQDTVSATGCRILVIDDNAHLPFYHADVLLNHGIHASKLSYSCSPETELLLGTAYALLRTEFQQSAGMARLTAVVARKLLVTLGGSDADNATCKVIEALQEVDIPELETKVVVGPMNPHTETLRQLVSVSRCQITLETAVQDMSSLMLWADLAVSAAGGTCWELACLGVPMVNIVVAENQEKIAVELDAAGISVNLGRHQEVAVTQIATVLNELLRAPDRRAQMSSRGKVIVDGHGANRVIDAMLEKHCLRAA